MQLVVLILHAMLTLDNVIVKRASVVQHVIHALRAIMVSQQADVNVSDFLVIISFLMIL